MVIGTLGYGEWTVTFGTANRSLSGCVQFILCCITTRLSPSVPVTILSVTYYFQFLLNRLPLPS